MRGGSIGLGRCRSRREMVEGGSGCPGGEGEGRSLVARLLSLCETWRVRQIQGTWFTA